MAGKLIINGKLTVLTGLHIGGSDAYSAIGAVDSPVIRNPYSGQPIIPGSSLKGKIRTLLAKHNQKNENGTVPEVDDDPIEIKRLFGSATKDERMNSRLQFSDSYINKDYYNKNSGKDLTEVKSENTINRATSEANPRSIERVVPGTEFDIHIVYDIGNEEEIKEDMDNLKEGLKLLQYDYLGGHGTRGSGRVVFSDFKFKIIDADASKVQPYLSGFNQLNKNALFNL